MLWIVGLASTSGGLLAGFLYWIRFRRNVNKNEIHSRTRAYVRRRLHCALFQKTDTTDIIFDRLLRWFQKHPPTEELMQDLSLLQQATDNGGVENYYAVTVYAAAMQAVADSFEPTPPTVKRAHSY